MWGPRYDADTLRQLRRPREASPLVRDLRAASGRLLVPPTRFFCSNAGRGLVYAFVHVYLVGAVEEVVEDEPICAAIEPELAGGDGQGGCMRRVIRL